MDDAIVTPDGRPAVFRDLPADHFPFHIEIVDDELGVVWEQTVEGPGALEVPGFGPERESHRTVKVVYANGQTAIVGPDGERKENRMTLERLDADALNELAIGVATGSVYCVNDEEGVRLSFGHLLGMMPKEEIEPIAPDIGAVYEDYAKAGPRGINGRPFFFSMKFLHRDDLPLLVEKVEAKRKALEEA